VSVYTTGRRNAPEPLGSDVLGVDAGSVVAPTDKLLTVF
jgi:hypothetical protein